MADLIPVPENTPVPQIETNTRVLGGPGGPANRQAQALLNRQAMQAGTLARATLSFPDLASAEAAATTLPEGQGVDVESEQRRYRVADGSLVFVKNLIRLELSGDGGASMVSGKSARPFASKQTIQDLMDGVIRPSGFVGTPTERMQRAVEFVEGIGGATVDVPPGEISIGTVFSTNPGVYIKGASRRGTKIIAATNEDCFNFNFISTDGWGVKDLSIVYVGAQSAGVGINASAIGSATLSGEIENVYIERPFKAIQLRNSQGTSISKFASWYFHDAAISSDDALNDIFLSQVFLNGAIYGTADRGVNSLGLRFGGKAHAIMASQVEIVQCNRPMLLEGPAAPSVYCPAFSTFSDCFFDSSSNPVLVLNSRGIKFMGSWFSQRDVGCRVQNSVDTTFDTCSFTNNDKNGCSVAGSSKHTKFLNCTFDSNGQGATGSKNGLLIEEGVTDWSVIGGTFGNLGIFPAKQDVGIGIGSGTDRYEVSGANFDGNTFSPIYFVNPSQANSGSWRTIRSNVGFRTKSLGAGSINQNATSVVINHGLAVAPRPDQIRLTPASGISTHPVFLDTTSITDTSFTIRCQSAAPSSLFFTWEANVFND